MPKIKKALEEAKASTKGKKGETPSAQITVTSDADNSSSDTETTYSTTDTAIAMVSHLGNATASDRWILDLGASHNMCSNRSWFSHFKPLPSPINVVLADDHTIQGMGVGHITVMAMAGDKWHHAILQEVLYVPELQGNLLSVPQLVNRGISVQFTKAGCQLVDPKGNTFCETSQHGALYSMPIRILVPESARIAMTSIKTFPTEGSTVANTEIALTSYSHSSKADAYTWHRRLGHLNSDAVLRMVKRGMVQRMEISGGGPAIMHCEPCIKGKQTCSEILKETTSRADTVLGHIFTDVCGKLPTRSIEGFEYFVTFIDDKSRKVSVCGLKKKSDVARHLKEYIAHAENDTGHCAKVLRSDGGGEYTSENLILYLNEKGIKRELTTADTPQHNGVAE